MKTNICMQKSHVCSIISLYVHQNRMRVALMSVFPILQDLRILFQDLKSVKKSFKWRNSCIRSYQVDNNVLRLVHCFNKGNPESASPPPHHFQPRPTQPYRSVATANAGVTLLVSYVMPLIMYSAFCFVFRSIEFVWGVLRNLNDIAVDRRPRS